MTARLRSCCRPLIQKQQCSKSYAVTQSAVEDSLLLRLLAAGTLPQLGAKRLWAPWSDRARMRA
jgi:hypothetical protein